MAKALFLDRDGTIIRHVPYLHRPEDVELTPGAADALHAARAAGYRLFLLTNQSGVARGYFTLDEVERVNARMFALLNLGVEAFAGVCIATEHPDEPPVYRKPSPRYILEMMAAYRLDPAQCWMVGDNESDWHAGLQAHIRVAAVRSDLFSPTAAGIAHAHALPVFESLGGFVAHLLPAHEA
ncbi:MAG: HAD-IIIA family hydrolase [Candidatus Didemnitutus sp.]|nr:HAD-IIIA family hydrolase [Candidatus Didemnitutus sp.]